MSAPCARRRKTSRLDASACTWRGSISPCRRRRRRRRLRALNLSFLHALVDHVVELAADAVALARATPVDDHFLLQNKGVVASLQMTRPTQLAGARARRGRSQSGARQEPTWRPRPSLRIDWSEAQVERGGLCELARSRRGTFDRWRETAENSEDREKKNRIKREKKGPTF